MTGGPDGQPELVWSSNPRKAERRKKLVRWLPPALTVLIRVLYASLRVRVHVPPGTRRLFRSGVPFVLGFWHGHMLILSQVFRTQFREPDDLWTLISQHWDGELIARTVRPFGVHAIRGSSTRGGREAFDRMCDHIVAGHRVGITPDGPKGPRFRVVQTGILRLARATGSAVVPVSWSARPRLRMWSWDRFLIPLPFSRVVARYGEPIFLDPKEPIEAQRQQVEEQMNRLNHETDGEAREARCSAWIMRGAALGFLVRSLADGSLFARNVFGQGVTRDPDPAGACIGRTGPSGPAGRSPIWVHADSAAEVPALRALGGGMRRRGCLEEKGIFTCTRQDGPAEAEASGEAALPISLALDHPAGAGRVLQKIRPRLFVAMNTGIGPYLLFLLGKRGIPVVLVHGRISGAASCRNRRFRFFYRRVFSHVSVFGMQSRQDAFRMIVSGADPRRVFVTGSLDPDGSRAVEGTLDLLERLWMEGRADA
jgi:lysophospholipid acyltransferase (LPLAT)-like uncharacterized protein